MRGSWKLNRGAVVLALLGAIAPTAGAQSQDDPAVRWEIGDGLRLRGAGALLRVRTRLHLDLVEPELADVGRVLGEDFEPQANLRRARWLADLRFEDSTPLRDVRVRGQVDFSGSDIDWKDLYARYEGLGHNTSVRAGHFREPFGLEAMTSVTHLPFIERSVASNAFTPGRARGAAWIDRWAAGKGSVLTQVGVFRASDGVPFPSDIGTQRSLTARAIWQAPLSRGLAQLGGTVSLRDPGSDGIAFRARPGTRLLARTVDTGSIDADHFVTAGAEALLLGESWSSVIEWFGAAGSGREGDGAFFTGGHVSFARFLAGGTPTWNRNRGGLRASDVPDTWSSRDAGNGAVEAAARLTWVDLDGGDVRGGRSLDLEVGLNWYLQPATRVMLHWDLSRIDAPDGREAHGSAILARLQVQL